MKCPECDYKIKKTVKCLLSCLGCLTLLKRRRLSTSRFSRWSVHCPINEPNRDKSDPTVLYMDEPTSHYSPKKPPQFHFPPTMRAVGSIAPFIDIVSYRRRH